MRVVGAVCSAVFLIASCSSFDSADDVGANADAGDASSSNDGAAVADGGDAAPLGPNVIVAGEVGISSIAVDATDVYWTTGPQGGHVATCPKTGCTGSPRILAANQDSATRIALVGDRVAWIASDVVRSAQKSGGEVIDLTKGFFESAPTGFLIVGDVGHILDGRRVRVCNAIFTTVCDATVTGATSVSSSPLIDIVRSGSEDVLWSDLVLFRMSISALTTSAVHGDPAGFVVAVAESQIVYATKDGALRAIPLTGVPDGGTVTELALGLPAVTAIAVDVLDVIVLSEVAGKVLRVPRSGGVQPTELSAGLKVPRALAMYGNEVWVGVAGSGEIVRLTK